MTVDAENRISADFDHKSLEWLARRHAHNAELRKLGPVVWNPHYDGFWYVTGYHEVAAISRDSATFSSLYREDSSDGIRYIGIMGVPRTEGLPPVGIAESEGTRHTALRRLLNPYMLPAAVDRYRPFVEQAASWLLDQKVTKGHMDMVLDFTAALPAMLTMRMLGLPCDSWGHYAELFHAAAAYGDTSPEFEHAVGLVPGMVEELASIANERRRDPGDDIISKLVTTEIDRRPLSDDEVVAVVWNFIGGGLDTTTSLTSLALHHLEAHPDLRHRLADHPELIYRAGEEYLRWTSVNETLTRTCTADVELGGQQIARGDFVMMSWLAANFDPGMFDRPAEVVIDREPNEHLAFGVGPHRCIGLHVARALFEVMIREVLTRIPDYIVNQEETEFYNGNPELYGVVKMPVSFPPKDRLGTQRPF